jgi:hypothetical protein
MLPTETAEMEAYLTDLGAKISVAQAEVEEQKQKKQKWREEN